MPARANNFWSINIKTADCFSLPDLRVVTKITNKSLLNLHIFTWPSILIIIRAKRSQTFSFLPAVHRSPFSMWSFSSLWSCRDSDEGASACERPASNFSWLASVWAGVHLSCGSSLLPQSIKYLTVATICLTLSVWPSGHLRSNLLPWLILADQWLCKSLSMQLMSILTQPLPLFFSKRVCLA